MSKCTEAANEKLQQELDEIRNEYRNFVYAVSHDLSAPFRQIEGFTHIIQLENEDVFDKNTHRHFDFIVKASNRGKDILEALLEYSRLINAEFSSTDVDCNSIVGKVKFELSKSIEQTNAKIVCSDLPVIVGDSTLLYKLFFNLIHNAIHYRHVDRSPEISINAVELEKHWKFTISDNGIGFGDKMAKDVFIALRRGVSDKKYSGMGMGLTAAQSVVHRHDGKIWAESVKGNGSVFSFTLGV